MQTALELFAAAFVASVFGSMVGLGGGFILVPMLRMFFGLDPADAAGTSLVLVVANSASGSFTYFLQRRVSVKIGMMFAVGGIPGSIVGALVVPYIPAHDFDWIFGGFLVTVAIDMIINREKRTTTRLDDAPPEVKPMLSRFAILAGFIVGVVSSLFGIGGGVVVVPTLLYFSTLPAHAISATSHFAILLTSPVGLIVHGFQHDIRVADAIPLVLGGLAGGPIGARLSARLKSPNLLIYVAIALFVVAGSLVARHL
jgi:uncharacterized protein